MKIIYNVTGPAGAPGAPGAPGPPGKVAALRTCVALAAPGNIALGVDVAHYNVQQVWNETTSADVTSKFAAAIGPGGELSQTSSTGLTAGDTLFVSLQQN